MKIEKIKPIPKYIIERIKKVDKKCYPEPKGYLRFYAYLTKNDGELVKVTVAVRNYRKKWYCKQCVVHGIHSDICYLKDIYFSRLSGYHVDWFEQGIQKHPNWYSDKNWDWQLDRLFDPYAIIVNREYLDKFDEYKYSAKELYNHCDIFKYLRLYEQYPQLEYLMKAGFSRHAMSKQILRKVGKDKQFRNWLLKHKDDINSGFDVITILHAYKTNEDISFVQKYEDIRKGFCHDKDKSCICKVIKGKEWFKLEKYLKSNNINERSYADYIKACLSLNIDMTWNKNKYPHDFKTWHDIRTKEYEVQQIELDEYKRANFYKLFTDIANKYVELEKQDENYAIIIAKSPKELKIEGKALNHCVGRMDYDKRVVDERSLIFFVRNVKTIDTPLVTVEYSLKYHKVLQCYGERDHRPSDSILEFVNDKWLPFANKQIRKIQKATA